jgi:hypothetical protein
VSVILESIPDDLADEGVLPSTEETSKFKINIVRLPNIKHNDMDERGTEQQHKEISSILLSFLNG